MNAALAKEGMMRRIEYYSPKRVNAIGDLMKFVNAIGEGKSKRLGPATETIENDCDEKLWEINVAEKRQREINTVRSKKALSIIRSRMCTVVWPTPG